MGIEKTYDETTFAGRLKRARLTKGVTAAALSEYMGGTPSRGVIANIETNRKVEITTDMLIAFCDALDLRPEDLDPRFAKYKNQNGTAA